MPWHDYYEILKLHPSAESFLIETAYRRLARAYHPDVSDDPNANERMVLINEAYEVLSDQDKRREYDREWETRNRRSGNRKDQAAAEDGVRGNPDADTEPLAAPEPPDATTFGVEPNYYDRVLEGSHAWQTRKPILGPWLSLTIRILGWTSGFLLTFYRASFDEFWKTPASCAFVALPAAIELALHAMNRHRDTGLLRVLNYKFNPDPQRYLDYARAAGRYESDIQTVYVSRNRKYHTDPGCYGLSTSRTMPRWQAEGRGVDPCSHCGHSRLKVVYLPQPFGTAPAPPIVGAPKDARANSVSAGLTWAVAAVVVVATGMTWSSATTPSHGESLAANSARKSIDSAQPTYSPPAAASPKLSEKEGGTGSGKKVIAKLGQTLRDVGIHSRMTLDSHVFYKTKLYEYLAVNPTKSPEWMSVVLQNGGNGFVPSDAVAVLPYNVMRDRPSASNKRKIDPVTEASELPNYALNFVGTPYKKGGSDLNVGVDSAGFVKALYSTIGVTMPRTAAGQARLGRPVTRLENLQKGDRLYFWQSNLGKIGDAGIFLGLVQGEPYFIHSDASGGVHTSVLTKDWISKLVAARR